MTILEVKDLCFSYEKRHILDCVTLKVEKGSFVSIIGTNGSGKTTLLKVMSSILVPDKGRVSLMGKEINAKRESWQGFYHLYLKTLL